MAERLTSTVLLEKGIDPRFLTGTLGMTPKAVTLTARLVGMGELGLNDIVQSAVPNIETTTSGDTVVGESHIRFFVEPKSDKAFRETLETVPADGLIVLESPLVATSAYRDKTDVASFSQIALVQSQKRGTEPQYLEEERPDHYRLWERAGLTEFTTRTQLMTYFGFMHAMTVLYRNPITVEEAIAQVLKQFPERQTDQDAAALIVGVCAAVKCGYTPARDTEAKKVQNAWAQFRELDTLARDVHMNERIRILKGRNPNKKLFVVVGKNHFDVCTEALTGKGSQGIKKRLSGQAEQYINDGISLILPYTTSSRR